MPQDARLESFDLDGIPPFNQDLETQMPEKVKEFKAKVRAADAILIATPEYNHSMPGVLKNAIDWASRPYGENSFEDKPVAIMGASPGRIGTARAQCHLRQVCASLNMHPVNEPAVYVTFAHEKIDEKSRLEDGETREIIRELLESLVSWTKRLGNQTSAEE